MRIPIATNSCSNSWICHWVERGLHVFMHNIINQPKHTFSYDTVNYLWQCNKHDYKNDYSLKQWFFLLHAENHQTNYAMDLVVVLEKEMVKEECMRNLTSLLALARGTMNWHSVLPMNQLPANHSHNQQKLRAATTRCSCWQSSWHLHTIIIYIHTHQTLDTYTHSTMVASC